MTVLEVLEHEALASFLAAGLGWCLSQMFGMRRLRAHQRVLDQTKRRLKVKEDELVEQMEQSLRGGSKIDPNKLRILLFCSRCPGCLKEAFIERGGRCHGKENICPQWQIHHHSKCSDCGADWLETIVEQRVAELEEMKKNDERVKKIGGT